MKNITKKAFIVSLLVMIFSVVTLVGSTFAWFVDTSASKDNKIIAGNLDVQFFYATEASAVEADEWTEVTATSEKMFSDDVIWAPGTEQYIFFKLENVGALDAKYNLFIDVTNEVTSTNVFGEELKLSDHLQAYAYAVSDGTDTAESLMLSGLNEGKPVVGDTLVAGSVTDNYLISSSQLESESTICGWVYVTMPVSAGQEANFETGATVPSITFDVILVATQFDADESALNYPLEINTESGLKYALANGMDVKLTSDVEVTDTLTIVGDVTIDLNEYELLADTYHARPFEMTEGSSLTINAYGAEVNLAEDGWGLINVPAGTYNVDITLNGGTYTANTDNGAMIRLRSGGEGGVANIVLNDVTYIDNATDGGYGISGSGYEGTINLTVEGGTYEVTETVFNLDEGSINNATLTSRGAIGVCAYNGEVSVSNSTITAVPVGDHSDGSYATAIAASAGATVTVTNSKVTVLENDPNAYALTVISQYPDNPGVLYYDDATAVNTVGNVGVFPYAHGEVILMATSTEGIKAALAKGGEVVLTSDVNVSEPLTVSGDVVIDLNGYALNSNIVANRPFVMTEGSSLTLNAENANIDLGEGGYGLINVPAGVSNVDITLNGGTYTANTDNGAMIRLRSGGEGGVANISLNGVTYYDRIAKKTYDDGYGISTEGYEGTVNVEIVNSTIDVAHNAVEATNGTITNSNINSGKGIAIQGWGELLVEDSTVYAYSAFAVDGNYSVGIAATGNGVVTVKNCDVFAFDKNGDEDDIGTTNNGDDNYCVTVLPSGNDKDGNPYYGTVIYDVNGSCGKKEVFPGANGQVITLASVQTESLNNSLEETGSVTLTENVSTSDWINVGANQTLDGNGYVLDGNNYSSSTSESSDYDCAVMTAGGTVKNLTILNAWRGIGNGSNGYDMEGDVCVENVIVDKGGYSINFGVSSSTANLYTATFKNCELYGWASFNGLKLVEFDTVTFGLGDADYNTMVAYDDVEFKNCKFVDDYILYTGGAGLTLTFDDCFVEVNGSLVSLTVETFVSNLGGIDDDLRGCTVIIDGVTLDWTTVA